MDKRANKNLNAVQDIEEKLASLILDDNELQGLSQEAQEFFFCMLSQMNVIEVLKNEDSTTDCLGFGLAVRRPEHVVDDPTSVSPTLGLSKFPGLASRTVLHGHKCHWDDNHLSCLAGKT